MSGTKPLWNMGGTGRCDGARGMVNIELDVTLATSAMKSTSPTSSSALNMSIPAPQSIQDGQQKQGKKDDKGDSKGAKVLRIGSNHEGPPSEDASDDPKDKNQQ
ncbi:hypothetical protein B9Z65_4757 [Elsinoe australis]|uniref:Uncharacterized protein n=1 Tax=Elsinoe australis TaxID=40998 RepID=A0A2P8A5Y9_9PEZI|nr:hypothetical protein B9Z65_4757 [Elsinoe australis]